VELSVLGELSGSSVVLMWYAVIQVVLWVVDYSLSDWVVTGLVGLRLMQLPVVHYLQALLLDWMLIAVVVELVTKLEIWLLCCAMQVG
jgi:hypothetical protein